MMVPRGETKRRARWLGRGWWALCALASLGAACSEDDPLGGECVGGGGPPAGPADTHCVAADGTDRVQAIGACVMGARAVEASGGEADHAHEAEEEHPTRTGREADDDDCKYHVRFENTCVLVNEPVTFTLSLTRKFDGMPGGGAVPAYPEVFWEENPSHISPSNDIRATEGPSGTYDIGPIVFDRSGRWVIRFHYFEGCSDLTEDSPHGHVAFYIDVP